MRVSATAKYIRRSTRKTRLVTRAIKYDQGLPANLFSRQTLSDIRLEETFRP